MHTCTLSMMKSCMISGCDFVIVPRGEPSVFRVTLFFDQNNTGLDMTAATFNNMLTESKVTIVTKNNTHQSVNGSYYHISGLEVYRGRKQAIEISLDGFSLSNRGTIEVRLYNTKLSKDVYSGFF